VIAARVVLDAGGRILRFEASGHGGRAPAGKDIVCAAFTVLARTAYEALASLPGASVEGAATEPGSLRFSVRQLPEAVEERASGIADFLLVGLSGLEREYPGEVGITIEQHWRE
jgi:uncharacterized protein YsxB (DUF464 family)